MVISGACQADIHLGIEKLFFFFAILYTILSSLCVMKGAI